MLLTVNVFVKRSFEGEARSGELALSCGEEVLRKAKQSALPAIPPTNVGADCGTFTMFDALSGSVNMSVYFLTAAMFFPEMTIGPAWAVPMDVGGEFSGTVSGMMNMAGQFVGSLSPTVFGKLVSGGAWVAPFARASLISTCVARHVI